MKLFNLIFVVVITFCLISCGKENKHDIREGDTDNTFVEEDEAEFGSSSSEIFDDSDLSSAVDEDVEDEDYDENDSSSSTNEDWDALLKSYEQFVDKYIAYMKKAAKGDTNALSEYPSLLEKAEEFGNKLEHGEDYMSASQWAKYMKITQKMLSAASNIEIDTKALENATDDLNSLLGDDSDDYNW